MTLCRFLFNSYLTQISFYQFLFPVLYESCSFFCFGFLFASLFEDPLKRLVYICVFIWICRSKLINKFLFVDVFTKISRWISRWKFLLISFSNRISCSTWFMFLKICLNHSNPSDGLIELSLCKFPIYLDFSSWVSFLRFLFVNCIMGFFS